MYATRRPHDERALRTTGFDAAAESSATDCYSRSIPTLGGTSRRRGLRALVLSVAVAAALAGCGGGRHPPAATTAVGAVCRHPGAAHALTRIEREIVAIRRAARRPTKSTLDGNPAVNRATDVFLNDVLTAPIDNLQRQRLIDHAAGALVGSCQQCFQALEANRPNITIVTEHHRGSCQK